MGALGGPFSKNPVISRGDQVVELAQSEIVQIYRRRSGISQGEFGSRAFGTSYETGRTRMKNIELGRKVPTTAELEKIAAVLDVPVKELMPRRPADDSGHTMPAANPCFSKAVLNRFPGLDTYVDMLNKAARLEDSDLLAYLCDRIASLLKDSRKLSRRAVR